jgi:transmembrane sensor
MKERFWELMARYWSGDISREEKAELEQLLLEHPDHWLKAGLIEQLSYRRGTVLSAEEGLRLADRIKDAAEKDAAGASPSVEEEAPFARKLLSRRSIWTIALVLTGFLGLFLLIRYRSVHNDRYKLVTTEVGMKTRINLPDGSIIWLNAGSTLKYPYKFDKRMREVYLTGEGYFDVKHHAGKPFIVHTGSMDIRILGTAFNVRAYEDEDFTETSLIKGAVEVAVKEPGAVRKIRLQPSQKLILRGTSGAQKKNAIITTKIQRGKGEHGPRLTVASLSAVDDSLIAETAWLSNKLVYQDEPFEALARRLERWYGMHILVKDPKLAAIRFSGRADNLPIDKLLAVLQEIQPFRYSIREDSVIIQ